MKRWMYRFPIPVLIALVLTLASVSPLLGKHRKVVRISSQSTTLRYRKETIHASPFHQ